MQEAPRPIEATDLLEQLFTLDCHTDITELLAEQRRAEQERVQANHAKLLSTSKKVSHTRTDFLKPSQRQIKHCHVKPGSDPEVTHLRPNHRFPSSSHFPSKPKLPSCVSKFGTHVWLSAVLAAQKLAEGNGRLHM